MGRALTPKLKERIDKMDLEAMARMWRFAPAGEPLLQGDAGKYFCDRFESLGGMSPQISKQIGWVKP